MDNIGLRSPLEAQFLEGIKLWDALDYILHDSASCVLGRAGPCKPNAVISCRACAGLSLVKAQ